MRYKVFESVAILSFAVGVIFGTVSISALFARFADSEFMLCAMALFCTGLVDSSLRLGSITSHAHHHSQYQNVVSSSYVTNCHVIGSIFAFSLLGFSFVTMFYSVK